MQVAIRLLRVKQWTKNLFVFAAFIFTNRITQGSGQDWRAVLLAFAAMCLVSSFTYILNDIADAEKDRTHPKKKFRPIASGQVSPKIATGIAFALLAGGLIAGYIANENVAICLVSYLALQLGYNLIFRSMAIADVACIAAGFVIRVIAGAVAIDAKVSGWILLCTACLALLLGFGKRRHEFHLKKASGFSSRSALSQYNDSALDMLVGFSAALAAISYGLYSLESTTARTYPGLIMTTPFVLYGIARYLLIAFVSDDSGEPETLVLTDRHLLVCFVLFLVTAILALKGFQLPFILR